MKFSNALLTFPKSFLTSFAALILAADSLLTFLFSVVGSFISLPPSTVVVPSGVPSQFIQSFTSNAPTAERISCINLYSFTGFVLVPSAFIIAHSGLETWESQYCLPTYDNSETTDNNLSGISVSNDQVYPINVAVASKLPVCELYLPLKSFTESWYVTS